MENVLPGDRILLFTDGLSDLSDPSGRHFGEEGVREAAGTQIDKSPDQFFQHMLQTVRKVTGHEKFDDDVCMLAVDVKRLEYTAKEEPN